MHKNPKRYSNLKFFVKLLLMNTKLVIVRHGQSQWNLENRFTGWTDVPLTDQGRKEAQKAGEKIKELNITFLKAYTSVLTRAIHTLWEILNITNLNWLPVIKDYRLNEKNYGALTGLNKKEILKKYGEHQVFKWRRSFDILPPQLEMDDDRHPIYDSRYKDMLSATDLPTGESLKITLKRFIPLWKNEIALKLKDGKNLLIVAHGNSLRALILNLESLSPKDITQVEIKTGIPICYTLDKNLKILKKQIL